MKQSIVIALKDGTDLGTNFYGCIDEDNAEAIDDRIAKYVAEKSAGFFFWYGQMELGFIHFFKDRMSVKFDGDDESQEISGFMIGDKSYSPIDLILAKHDK